ncbi:NF-kappa-B-repressing factor [Orussus abietinus]|uniref:NF-kappa-B-repressing factor n=1 Tax=Orussus abietinus TaxID=222816 RepID=UPI0006251B49|nr:NF-kappa-B-repressing factor [Orussus abietinus]XP_012280207.1 NF-kappa-B-repressing factor [Orussus abietinus]
MTGKKDLWDVEQYKLEHECEDHWELRRKFLLAHHKKFPEDELLCLAQVFINVELLGCRYPEETMQVVADLSHDVAKDYREKQKTKLQRTFVKASDVANAKVKGLRQPPTSQEKPNSQPRRHKNSSLSTVTCINDIPNKRLKLDTQNLPYGDIVLIEHPGDAPQSIVANAVNASGGNLQWKFERTENNCICNIFIDTTFLTKGLGINQKAAKKEAGEKALLELRKYYYTIQITKAAREECSTAISGPALRDDKKKNDSLPCDNIGQKLMKLMGWSGGGLGKTQQGITEPITVQQQMSRKGLGLNVQCSNMDVLKRKCKEIFTQYISGDMTSDLVFATDFTNEERALIHRVARQMGVKSHSYGPKDQRMLIVSRKVKPRELVEELKNLGGSTKKYVLVEPSGTE